MVQSVGLTSPPTTRDKELVFVLDGKSQPCDQTQLS